ncbi:MAG TPA: maleylpyruvate isomerase family mycothiol-dependent enzyme [Acidimicrobiia bacterium]|nr:maleylpyruvate isomerase family mycothiol-dependent enzyme [Acidimicrobiia bacterium]
MVPDFEQQREQIRAVGPNLPDLLQALQVERRALLGVLDTLRPDDWRRSTPCPGWAVHDLVLHLLGDDLGVLAILRDGHAAPLPAGASLAEAIDALNDAWIGAAAGRFSPRMLRDMLAWSGDETHRFFAAEAWDAPSAMGVSWAGTAPSPHVLEVAREYTERWLHQQQLRETLRCGSLGDPILTRVLLHSLAHCLPVAYAGNDAPEGSTVRLAVTGFPTLSLGLRRDADAWRLLRGADLAGEPDCSIVAPGEPLWRAWTTNGTPAELEAAATVHGPAPDLARPLWQARAIISSQPIGR